VLAAYADPGVLATALTSELRAETLLDGGMHTAYLCAPAHEQRRLQPLFATLVQEIIARAYDRTTETGKPLDPPLLLVLDECANIAPLRDLATLASTGAGQGIQLVSVFQDIAQINAVYGRDRAPTIVSNHRAKVILSGIADPPTLEYLARLLGDEEAAKLLQATLDEEGEADKRLSALAETSINLRAETGDGGEPQANGGSRSASASRGRSSQGRSGSRGRSVRSRSTSRASR
jgi:type IV secretion system protein VirD4